MQVRLGDQVVRFCIKLCDSKWGTFVWHGVYMLPLKGLLEKGQCEREQQLIQRASLVAQTVVCELMDTVEQPEGITDKQFCMLNSLKCTESASCQ